MKKIEKPVSTFEREMQDSEFAKPYREDYQELVLSELLLALIDEDDKSIQQLAEEAGVAITAIQNIRLGKSEDMGLKNFVDIVKALGYTVVLEKNGHRIPFASSIS